MDVSKKPIINKTYAVVIGISDYQDGEIPDLRFADKDAAAFANYLRSPAGGSLSGDHLLVLTNENATAGRIAAALDGLLERAKEGDQVLIYFSCHGDVERKTISQPGFLLCWDAPRRVYMGGGTYSLLYLQEIVSTLAVTNKAKVVVVADACHAGKLAGSQIAGPQLTSANLARQFANEVKIMSCQPEELSLEGEQWGGGRGLFSYHFVEGLYGLADANGDGIVTTLELNRYLEDHVTSEAAPQNQMPILLGNKTEQLSFVNPAILADLKKAKAGLMPVFAATEGRGLEDEVMEKADSSIRELYMAFKKAVNEKRFFPKGKSKSDPSCADELFALLSQNQTLASLHGLMRRNYAAALQDDAQQTLNEGLKTRQTINFSPMGDITHRMTSLALTEKIRTYPRCLDRAAELLGARHYLYATLKARRYYFEGFNLASSNRNPDAELGEKALALFRQSLSSQPDQPHVFWQMSQVYGHNMLAFDSMEQYVGRALEVHPNWVKPSLDAAFVLFAEHQQFERAKPLLEQANRIDSSNMEVLYNWGCYQLLTGHFDEAARLLEKALAQDSGSQAIVNALGGLYCFARRYDLAEPYLEKAIELDSTYPFAWNNLGGLYIQTNRFAKAEQAIFKAIALDSTAANSTTMLGSLYVRTGKFADAEMLFRKAIRLDSTLFAPWNNLGDLYYLIGRFAEAEPFFNKSLQLDPTNHYIWDNVGKIHTIAGRYALADSCLRKAISLDSTVAIHWFNLGSLYFEQNRFEECLAYYLKTLELDPTYKGLLGQLGAVYLNLNRYDEAEATLNKSLALDPTNSQAHYWMGKLYLKTHRPEEARKAFLKFIEINPKSRGARLGMAAILIGEGKTGEAFDYVKDAIEKGGATFQFLQTEPLTAPLRELPEWKALMKKYFPDQNKD